MGAARRLNGKGGVVEIDKLTVGSFYWIQIALDPDADNEWENQAMPARYEGSGKWTYLGQEGVSDWPVRWIGNEIREG